MSIISQNKCYAYVHFIGSTSLSSLFKNWPMKIIQLSSRVWDFLVGIRRVPSVALQSPSSTPARLCSPCLVCTKAHSCWELFQACPLSLHTGLGLWDRHRLQALPVWVRMLASRGWVWSQPLSHHLLFVCWLTGSLGENKELWLVAFAHFCGINIPTMANFKPSVACKIHEPVWGGFQHISVSSLNARASSVYQLQVPCLTAPPCSTSWEIPPDLGVPREFSQRVWVVRMGE